jgi:hypothetical protein
VGAAVAAPRHTAEATVSQHVGSPPITHGIMGERF